MDQLAPVFVDAWNDVLSTVCSKKVLSADVLGAGQVARPSDISVTMGIIGDVDGRVFLSMDRETGTTLASEMLGGMDVAGMDDVVTSAVGELCNMIMGNACAGFGNSLGMVDITPPNFISYEEAMELERNPLLCISLALEEMGFVDFDVSLPSA